MRIEDFGPVAAVLRPVVDDVRAVNGDPLFTAAAAIEAFDVA
jgi:hypothetical protein